MNPLYRALAEQREMLMEIYKCLSYIKEGMSGGEMQGNEYQGGMEMGGYPQSQSHFFGAPFMGRYPFNPYMRYPFWFNQDGGEEFNRRGVDGSRQSVGESQNQGGRGNTRGRGGNQPMGGADTGTTQQTPGFGQ